MPGAVAASPPGTSSEEAEEDASLHELISSSSTPRPGVLSTLRRSSRYRLFGALTLKGIWSRQSCCLFLQDLIKAVRGGEGEEKDVYYGVPVAAACEFESDHHALRRVPMHSDKTRMLRAILREQGHGGKCVKFL